jgi:predicted AAA+ superfamily ATPase
MPELHIIAAGSLLEFALGELPSFGVGRVRSLFIYPLSFDEFLAAKGESNLVQLKKQASFDKPIQEPFHSSLIALFKKFLILGGMPEVIANYIQNQDLLKAQSILDDLVISIKADFVKYKKRVPSLRIAEVFESIALQMGGKFIYTKAATQASIQQIKDAIDLLIMAGIVIPVTHTSANGIPLGAEQDPKKRKMLLYDTGIFQRISGLDLSEIIVISEFNAINKGSIAELFVGLELLKYANPYQQEMLFYWQRETTSSNAEVDYLIQKQQEIIPIEVKSSGRGSMNSLFQFLKEKKREKGIRISLERFSKMQEIEIYPLYAVSSIK